MKRLSALHAGLALLATAAPAAAAIPDAVASWSFDEGQGTTARSVVVVPPRPAVPPGCVGYWKFDEGQGTTAKDASPTGNTGTLKGATWVDGKNGKAVSFAGHAAVELAKGLSGWLGRSATLGFWIKSTQRGNDTFWQAPAIAGVEEAGAGNDIFWGYVTADGRLGLQAGDAGGAVSTTVVCDGRWHHVVLVRSMEGTVKILVDGKLETEAGSEGGEKTTAFAALGRRENTGGGPAHFQGTLDDVMLFDRALNPEQIAACFGGAAAGPVDMTATLKGATWTDGKFGKAAALGGGEACVAVPADLARWMGKTATLAFWIKTKQAGDDDPAKAPALAGSNEIVWGYLTAAGRIAIQAGEGEAAESEKAVNDGQWHHVALTRKAESGKVEIYVDGQFDTWVSSEAHAKKAPFGPLGRRKGAGTAFQGALDEVRLYRRILTAEEVQKLFKNEDR